MYYINGAQFRYTDTVYAARKGYVTKELETELRVVF